MRRWWMGAALLTAWAATASPLWAQFSAATPFGPARFQDPIPCATTPDMQPGPLPASQMPPGPPDCLSLNRDHSNAFPDEVFEQECGLFFHAGGMGLMRSRFGHMPIALLDPQNLDTGLLPPQGTRQRDVVDTRDVPQDYNYGPRATLGVQYENRSFEVTGWYLSEVEQTWQRVLPGQLDVLAQNVPFGFSGDNGLFLQADQVTLRTTLKSGSFEANYRYSDLAVTGAELIIGGRFFYFQESFNLFVDDDGISQPDINGRPDPLRQANYRVEARNFIVAPQFGFEYGKLVCEWLSLGFTAKGAWGADFATTRNRLTRGDSLRLFPGFGTSNSAVSFTHIYDTSAFVEVHFLERFRVRGGYQALWLLNISNAQDQIDLNFANVEGPRKSTGDVFMHGPMFELQFFF